MNLHEKCTGMSSVDGFTKSPTLLGCGIEVSAGRTHLTLTLVEICDVSALVHLLKSFSFKQRTIKYLPL